MLISVRFSKQWDNFMSTNWEVHKSVKLAPKIISQPCFEKTSYTWYNLAMKVIANRYPGYDLAMKVVCQTTLKVWFCTGRGRCHCATHLRVPILLFRHLKNWNIVVSGVGTPPPYEVGMGNSGSATVWHGIFIAKSYPGICLGFVIIAMITVIDTTGTGGKDDDPT